MPQFAITIPTEPIGSIPRPVEPLRRIAQRDSQEPALAPFYDDAIRDTIAPETQSRAIRCD
jgi:5-methyltetrahydropteroyltriglutamate--homocysteine methyltransferase